MSRWRVAVALIVATGCGTLAPWPMLPTVRGEPAATHADQAKRPAPTAPVTVRLPRPFTIARASLDLAIDPVQATMAGRVRFAGVMTGADDVIWLHAQGPWITRAAAVPAGGGAPIALEVITGLADGRLALRAPAPLMAGSAYTIELDYRGLVSSHDGIGTFRRQRDGRCTCSRSTSRSTRAGAFRASTSPTSRSRGR